MTIYTRRGDHGETSLGDGTRGRKDGLRVEAYGAVDEANSFVGQARAACADPRLDAVLGFAQHRLFNCSSRLAAAVAAQRPPGITLDDISALEAAVDAFEATSGPAGGFVLEGGCESAARLHVARAVVRRAERRVVALAAAEHVDETVLAFLNRLSDVLFAAARYANTTAGATEELWDPSIRPPVP